jgi:periplasmic protein TonB
MSVLLLLSALLPGVIAPPNATPPAPLSPPVLVGEQSSCLDYSPEALAASHQEKTIIAFLVTADGDVAEVMVTGSSGSRGLDAAAMSCVRKWRFKPATQNGEAVNSIGAAAIDWPKP